MGPNDRRVLQVLSSDGSPDATLAGKAYLLAWNKPPHVLCYLQFGDINRHRYHFIVCVQAANRSPCDGMW